MPSESKRIRAELTALSDKISHLLSRWELQQHKQDQQHREIMNALKDLTDVVTQVSGTTGTIATAVDAAVTEIQSLGPNDAQLQTLTQTLITINTTLAAQAQRLTDAVNTPTPAPAPTQ